MLQQICCTRNNVATNLMHQQHCCRTNLLQDGGRNNVATNLLHQKQCCNKFVAPETMLQQICCRTVAETMLQQICCTRNNVATNLLQDGGKNNVAGWWQKQCCNKLQQICCTRNNVTNL